MKIIDELTNRLRSIDVQIDQKTGHKMSKYERYADWFLRRMYAYKPAPKFVFYVKDFGKNSQLTKELDNLDDETLDDVFVETITRLFDFVNNGKFFWKRSLINWEVLE